MSEYRIVRPCRQTHDNDAIDHLDGKVEVYVTGPHDHDGVIVFSSTHDILEATMYEREEAESYLPKWDGARLDPA